ncbi:hypothetical protein K469DRAFT_805231 [Zopfia rhizophila CBS 207.26]|uniref:Uncharacterized protein n=1 Tax=Zopfia rhizophila CBS 207.26 TaxID=1314779 RepID=A0A6A6EMI6_9PEZI|nr:hypothetical protein K469DRAFT_805231 [Zopfia rhizophila CBS 207.26]
MFITKEWFIYTNERAPLRVTSPVGSHRGMYRLNIPFRYAILMIVMSGAFHWLASQSIFIVRITSRVSIPGKQPTKSRHAGIHPSLSS